MWTQERKELVIKLWNDGLSGSQIADRVGGLSRNAVLGLVHRKGLMGRRNQGAEQAQINRIRHSAKARADDKARIRLSALSTRRKVIKERLEGPIAALMKTLPAEPLPPVDTMPAQVSMNDLEAHHCRAPVGTDFHPDKPYFCGEQKVPGSSYCECHTRRYMTAITVVKAKQPERPTWQDTRTGRKGAVFLSGREKMKAY